MTKDMESDNLEADPSALRLDHATAMCLSLGGESGKAPVSGELKDKLEKICGENGGKVSWVTGRRLESFWGLGESWEEGPASAARAAIAARDALYEQGSRPPAKVQLSFRIGISTGAVALGPSGPGEAPAASGKALDLARQINDLAPPGGILLSEHTYRHLRGIFEVAERGEFSSPGAAVPVGLYLLERVKPRAFQIPIRGVGSIETRTIGRDSELEELKVQYREAAGGSSRFVFVVGEAGVGKSRLLYEFEKWLELLPEEVLFFESQATPETARRPYGVFRDLFSFRFEIRDSDSSEEVREKFRKGLAEILEPGRAEVMGHWLGFDFSKSPSVSGLLGSTSFRQQAQADLLTVFRTLGQNPAVMFLEDLHWADDSSLDLLELLSREVAGCSIMFVCVARPQLFDRRKDFCSGAGNLARLDLPALTEEHSRALVEEILQRMDGVPDRLRDLIVGGAKGNPFYVEELILLLIDMRVILAGEDRWKVDLDRLGKAKLPDTLKGILRARLDCLPSRDRQLLQCASVVGRQFWGGAVDALSEAEGEAEGDHSKLMAFDAARERQLIFPAKSSSFEGSQEFTFKHAILRDIIYDSVMQPVRQAYHSAAARWLEHNLRGRKAEYLPVIAEHFEAAGENSRAAEYLLHAGEELSKVSAIRDSISAFERALQLLPEGQKEHLAPLLTGLGDSCRVLGDHAAAKRHLARAVEVARQVGDAKSEVAALNALARTTMILGSYSEAKPYLSEALKLASRNGYQEGAAKVLLNLADVSFRLGDSKTAMSAGQQSLEIAREIGDSQGIGGAHRVLGFACMMLGDNPAAADHHRKGLEIFQTIGDRWGMATCLINVGEVNRKMGKFEEAVSYWEKSLPISSEIGAKLSVSIAHCNIGGTLAAREGQEDRAISNLKSAMEEALAIGALPIVLEALVSVAVICARDGRQLLAARLLGTVTNHPSFNAEIQEYSDPLLKRLEKKLGPESMRTLINQGRGRDLAAVVGEVVKKTN